jgi:hypothetical protein
MDISEINDPARASISLILDTFVPLIYVCRSYWKKSIKIVCLVT